jgi:hypothetical protein
VVSPVRRAAVAVVALLAGLVCLGLWRLIGGTERQPYAPGAEPPRSVHVTQGHTYAIAVSGGVPALLAAGVPVSTGQNDQQSPDLECDWSTGGGVPESLETTPESTTTKATAVVGSFVAPVSGRITVNCQHWGTVFVPDADDAPGDPSGWFLAASTVLLCAGGAAAMSAGWAGMSQRSAAEDEDEYNLSPG